jgi:hypothetical protein
LPSKDRVCSERRKRRDYSGPAGGFRKKYGNGKYGGGKCGGKCGEKKEGKCGDG